VEYVRNGQGAEGLGVPQDIIVYMFTIEIFFECARDGHGIAPVVAGLTTEVGIWMD
jgi:hypothetical protein